MISYHYEDSVLSQLFFISISYHFQGSSEYFFTTFVLGRDEQERVAPEKISFTTFMIGCDEREQVPPGK